MLNRTQLHIRIRGDSTSRRSCPVRTASPSSTNKIAQFVDRLKNTNRYHAQLEHLE